MGSTIKCIYEEISCITRLRRTVVRVCILAPAHGVTVRRVRHHTIGYRKHHSYERRWSGKWNNDLTRAVLWHAGTILSNPEHSSGFNAREADDAREERL